MKYSILLAAALAAVGGYAMADDHATAGDGDQAVCSADQACSGDLQPGEDTDDDGSDDDGDDGSDDHGDDGSDDDDDDGSDDDGSDDDGDDGSDDDGDGDNGSTD